MLKNDEFPYVENNENHEFPLKNHEERRRGAPSAKAEQVPGESLCRRRCDRRCCGGLTCLGPKCLEPKCLEPKCLEPKCIGVLKRSCEPYIYEHHGGKTYLEPKYLEPNVLGAKCLESKCRSEVSRREVSRNDGLKMFEDTSVRYISCFLDVHQSRV